MELSREQAMTPPDPFIWHACGLPPPLEVQARLVALELIVLRLARIEHSADGFTEFCFQGIRHVYDGEWVAVLAAIGWTNARAAITKAQKGAPC